MNHLSSLAERLLCFLCLALSAFAAPGDLDSTFGTAGKVITSLAGNDVGRSVVVQGDGKILVAGSSTDGGFDNFAVVRYTVSGVLDPDFGTGGQVVTDVAGSIDYAMRMTLQSDGKIVVVGQVFNGSDYDFGIVRYETDGSLDGSFGAAGRVITPMGSGNNVAYAVAVQPDGAIVVVGAGAFGGGNDIAVARYTASGALDPGFGTGGIVTTSVGGDDAALGVVVQGDGKIVVAGYSNTGTDYDVVLLRYTASGALDADFGTGGIVTTPIGSGNDFGASVALQADGKILVGGSSMGADGDFALVRYTSSGGLDPSFNGTGKVTTDLGGGNDNAQGVAVQADGKIVLAGFAEIAGENDFALARYHADGSLDTDFHGTGKVTTGFGGADVGSGMALQGDGKIVVAGYSNAVGGGNNDFAVARYLGVLAPGDVDSLDANVADGVVIGSAQQPDGKTILIGTFTSVSGVPRNNVARLNADGSLDMNFDPNTSSTGPGGGRVNGVAVMPDGKIVLAGFFTELQPNGASAPTTRNYIARVNADGTLDASFDLQVDNIVYGLAARSDGKLLLWGVFSSVLGTTRNNVARLNANGTLDAGFDPNPNDFIFAAAVQGDGKVLLGGGFTSLDPNAAGAPVSRRYFARVNDDGSVDMGFDPSPNVRVFSTREQADGKVLLSGDFTALQPNNAPSPTTRNHIARVNADGSLDTGFNPDAPGFETNSVALQADGQVLFTGGFITVQGTTRNYVARVAADGTLDASFDPNPSNFALSVTLQDDGKVQLGGGFIALQPNGAASPTPRSFFARLANDPATSVVTAPDATTALWQRGGAATEVSGVIFEKSLDNGATWTPLGIGSRVGTTANWQRTGLSLGGQLGKLRARGITAGGYFNGSGGLIEQTGDFEASTGFTLTPTLTAPAANSGTKSPITVTYTLPEAALSGTVKLTFVRASDGSLTRTLTLADMSAGEHTFTFDPANPLASSAVASITPPGSDIPDLIYNVTLSYQDAAGNPAASVTNNNVKIDTLTQAPALLSSPQIGGSIGGSVTSSNPFSSLLINLPEAPLPGSVTFTFDDGTTQYVFTTTTAVSASGSTQIVINTANMVGASFRAFPVSGNPLAFASGPSVIPVGGPYSVSFTYQDAVGNSAVMSNVVTGVMIDLVTQTPTLTLPAANALLGNPVTVKFTLPEDAFDSTGVMTLNFGATSLTLDQSLRTAGEHTFTFNPADPVGTSGGAITNGGAIADGTYAVTFSYRDAVFNAAATATNTGVRIDTTPPTFTPSFSPTIVYAGTAIGDYRLQAGASDPNGIFNGFVGIGQNPPTGTVLTAGTQQVTLTAADNAGNSASTSFDLIVRPATPPSDVKYAKNDGAPDAGLIDGLPGDAVLASFGVPAIDDNGNIAFTAKWTSPGPPASKGSGLFTDLACLGIVGGEVPGITGATFKSFNDPVISGGNVACIATIAGAVKGTVVLFGPASGPLEVLAQSGTVAPNADGANFKSFGGVGVAGDTVGFLATLAAGSGNPKATAASDVGLWLKDGAQPLDLVLREGSDPLTKPIKTIVSFKTGNGSPGAGRGWVRQSFQNWALALVAYTDKTPVVLQAGNGVGKLNNDANVAGETFASFGLPTANAIDDVAFLAKLAIGPTVTKANASGIFMSSMGSADFDTIARVGDPAPGTGANFKLLKDPILSDDGGLAFPATITAKGAAGTTLWWQPSGGALALLAQGGAEPGDLPGAQWKALPSLAIATNRGPVFTATLVPGKGGVTAKSASGVWACDFNGDPRLLFRTGVPDEILPGQTLKSFTLLNATKGSLGVTRSINAAQQVVWLATFADKSQAIVVTDVP